MWFFGRTFWGIVLVFLGITIILDQFFGIDFPFWGVFWSVVLIAFGLSLLLKKDHDWPGDWRPGKVAGGDIVFNDAAVEGDEKQRDYNIIFSRGEIDLRKISAKDKNIYFRINNVFAGGSVIIDKNKPVKVAASSAFGSVVLPNGRNIAFGETEYVTSSFSPEKPFIFIKCSAVFGELNIIEGK